MNDDDLKDQDVDSIEDAADDELKGVKIGDDNDDDEPVDLDEEEEEEELDGFGDSDEL